MLSKSWKIKFFFAFLSVLLGVYFVLPNFVDKTAPWAQKILPNTQVNLGLDLQGGIHLVLGVDVERALVDEADTYAEQIKELLKKEGIAFQSIDRNFENTSIKITFMSSEAADGFEEVFQNRINVPDRILEVVSTDALTYYLDVPQEHARRLETQTISQALETLRNRVDEFGVSEPSIQAQGRDRIIIQLPGMEDPERAKSIIGKTAQLSFMVVDDDSLSDFELNGLVSEAKSTVADASDSRSLNRALQGKLPEGTQVYFKEIKDDSLEGDGKAIPILVKSTPRLTGDTLDHAQVSFDENNWPQVELRFNPTGASLLDTISGDNIGKRMAIILDEKVYSDPVLQSRISDGKPRITFPGLKSRNEIFRDAKDLAVVLRAGALPAPVEILETRAVGPSLGRDSIENGLKAILIGVLIIIVFMAFYYRASGIIADFAVITNVVFILACLGILGGTLTLPGIAGILISIGMAVDANVIIYERIREELLRGRGVAAAVEEGYRRANLTILDSNVTTVITAFVLLEFGTGPIKGFAITLIFGLIANYITALWFTRLIFDWYITKYSPKRLSI